MLSAKAMTAHIIQYSVTGSAVTEQREGQGRSREAEAAKRLVGQEIFAHRGSVS